MIRCALVWLALWFLCLSVSVQAGSALARDALVAAAREKHGEPGAEAARFLVRHMPAVDAAKLDDAFLQRHLDLAMASRKEFPWAAKVPWEIYLNDVLPYAVLDETREDWRTQILSQARPLVLGAASASEAAKQLNEGIFHAVNVRYDTTRRAPNQSPLETIGSGKASCTGLSILLVAACRSVGIPARVVGTPLWTNGSGNHTWVEIWDDGWHFTGAAEADPKGLNHGWFVEDAARARAAVPEHAIYATSWEPRGTSFPMVWNPQAHWVSAENVTARYARPDSGPAGVLLGLRLRRSADGPRMAARAWIVDEGAQVVRRVETRDESFDQNDMPRVALPVGAKPRVVFQLGSESRIFQAAVLASGQPIMDVVWQDLMPTSSGLHAVLEWLASPAATRKAADAALTQALNAADALLATRLLAAVMLEEHAKTVQNAVAAHELKVAGKSLRWLEKEFGESPPDGRSLWISLHGGGNAPTDVNDAQWRNQVRLYQPAEGIYAAPRAPTDTWNLWHEAHVDRMFQEWIEAMVAVRGVNPDKVYLLGYSAGGDGVWQLAPRMADRFAAAAMMAGHPNEASLLGLRNLPFALFMGAEDAAYDRNRVAAKKAEELAALHKADPQGYQHFVRIYPGLGHWMQGKDAEALPWMAGFRRNPWPHRIVWHQDDVIHNRFYWLARPDNSPITPGETITANVDGQRICLDGAIPAGLCVRLSDTLLDLDRPIEILTHGKPAFSGTVPRQARVIAATLGERLDLPSAATAEVCLP